MGWSGCWGFGWRRDGCGIETGEYWLHAVRVGVHLYHGVLEDCWIPLETNEVRCRASILYVLGIAHALRDHEYCLLDITLAIPLPVN